MAKKMTDSGSTFPDIQTLKISYLGIREIFVDGLSGIHVRNGIAKLNFFSVRHAEDGRDEAVAAATLAINLGDLVAMSNGLQAAVKQLQDQGMISILDTRNQNEGNEK